MKAKRSREYWQRVTAAIVNAVATTGPEVVQTPQVPTEAYPWHVIVSPQIRPDEPKVNHEATQPAGSPALPRE